MLSDARRSLRKPSVSDTPAETHANDDGGSDASVKGWWEDEDPDAPWMTQATRLLPKSTIALWQFTP